MVAVVGFTGELGETHGHERLYLDASFTHALEELAVNAPAAHVVVDDAHLNASPRTVDEGVADETAQGVVLEDIDVDVDMALRLGDVAQQGREELVAVDEYVDAVGTEGKGVALSDEHVDYGFVLFRDGLLGLFGKPE